MRLQIVHSFSDSIYFIPKGFDAPTICTCASFIAQDESGTFDLYRLVVRVSDGAYQVLKGIEERETFLFSDYKCQKITPISITSKWIFSQRDSSKRKSYSLDSSE